MTGYINRTLVLIGLICMSLGALPLTAVFPTPTAHAASANVYWGAYVKGNTYGYADAPWDTRAIDTFEAHAGKKVAILHWGQPWFWSARGGYQKFQRNEAEKVRLRRSIPMITWTSEDLSAPAPTEQPAFQLAAIINGKHDAYIRQWARDAKSWGYPLLVRFNHEMNGSWYNWSEVKNGNSAGQYVRMWQHVVDIFKAEQATNVTWVWAPNRVWSTANPLPGLYPGDAYVDWVGMSGYNWGTNPAKPKNTWQSFDVVFKQTYDELGQLAPTKPIMITETSSTEFGGSKAAWITEVLTSALPRYPRINALVWFNWNCPATNGNMDWVIESSPSAQAALANGIASSYYATNTFGALPFLTKVQPLVAVAPSSSKLDNGSFETASGSASLQPWTIKNTLNASISSDTTTVMAGTRSLKVHLPSASASQPWSVQLRQANKSIAKGKTYTIAFYAKASSSRSLNVLVQDTTAPYSEFFKQTSTVTSTWTKYTYTFVATASDTNTSVVFNLAQAPGQVWLDDVTLFEQ